MSSISANIQVHQSTSSIIVRVLATALGSFYFGYSLGVLNLAQTTINQVLDIDSDIIISLCSTMVPVGAAFGTLISGYLLSTISLRKTILLVDVIGIIGVLFCTFSSVTLFLFGRFIVGLVTGLNSQKETLSKSSIQLILITIPLVANFHFSFLDVLNDKNLVLDKRLLKQTQNDNKYVANIELQFHPVSLSGITGSITSIMISGGLIISYCTGYGFLSENLVESHYWKWVMFLPAFTCATRFASFIIVYKREVPSYYLQNGDDESAQMALRQIYNDEHSRDIIDQFHINKNQNKSAVQKKDENEVSNSPQGDTYSSMFSDKYRMRLFIGIGLQILQQFCGINAVIFYSSKIFNQVTKNMVLINTLTVIIGINGLVMAFVSGLLTQYFGRKSMLFYGNLFCLIFLISLAFMTRSSDKAHVPSPTMQNLTIMLIFCFLASFCLTLGPIVWIYNAEILPEKGNALATFTNWVGVIIISFSFPLLVNSFGISFCYVCFAICCVIGVFFIQRYVQETKGLTQFQIEDLFVQYKSRKFAKI